MWGNEEHKSSSGISVKHLIQESETTPTQQETLITIRIRCPLSAVFCFANNVVGQCYASETAALQCYIALANTPQDVNLTDITYVAAYLRAYGKQLKAGRFLNMLTTDGSDCPEWSLYTHGSVLVTAKHINSAVNSSVLFKDIANTIDVGASATASQQATALISCGSYGGAEGVAYNATNPAYGTTAYLASGYTPSGIVIKIVSSGA